MYRTIKKAASLLHVSAGFKLLLSELAVRNCTFKHCFSSPSLLFSISDAPYSLYIRTKQGQVSFTFESHLKTGIECIILAITI